jgi:hypothetical protein
VTGPDAGSGAGFEAAPAAPSPARLHPPRAAPPPAGRWALLAELDDLLERRYGPRTLRAFMTPAG